MLRRVCIGIVLLLTAACGGSEPQPAPQADLPPQAAAPPPGSAALPPIPLGDAGRPPDIVRAVYSFAADHPEILGKVPCFCGCQSRGHRDNDDCFVAARGQSGRVTAWEPHGAT